MKCLPCSRPSRLEQPAARKSRSSRLPRRSCRLASAQSIADRPASAATSSGEESVTLRDETVTVERRRPVAAGETGLPAGAFEERTIEVHQTAEEPVVSKTAHIAEEVVVRKDVTERTETVRDDVRREQVDVRDASQRQS